MALPLILTDADIEARLGAADALHWIEEALLLRAGGELHAPPRTNAPLAGGYVAFTVGATPTWFGYRSYDTSRRPPTTKSPFSTIERPAR